MGLKTVRSAVAGGAGEALTTARIELVRGLRAREAELREAVFAHVRSSVPDAIADRDAQLTAGLRETIAICVDCGLASIEQGTQWSGTISPAVALQARRNAANGVGLTTALRRSAAGYTLAWGFVLSEVAGHDFPEEQRFALLQQASSATMSLLACIQAEIADAHSSEIKRRAHSREQRRAELAHRLLAGERLNAGKLAELGYDLDGWHLGVIAAGALAARTIRGLAAGLGCELLPVAHGRDEVWAWLGGQRRVAFADVERILDAAKHTDVSLAIGEPAQGIEGWHRTHREAAAALLVARYWPRSFTRYLDVAADAMALQNEAFADSLIETYLSPLDGMRIGGQAARRTLGALLAKRHNVSSAASALSLDRSTVHRHRNEIERRLGYRLHERQAEIEIALRIEDLRQRRDGDHAGVLAGARLDCACC
jgi:GGDEF-like domain